MKRRGNTIELPVFTDFEDLQLNFESPPTLKNNCARAGSPATTVTTHLANVQRTTPERHPRYCFASTTGATLLRNSRIAAALLFLLPPGIALCQATPVEPVPQESQPAQTRNQTQTQTQAPAQTQSPTTTPATPQKSLPEAPSSTVIDPNEKILHQTPRIMGVLPNFTAVDSNTRLPRLSTREKFIVAMHDSVDYSSFLLVAGLAGKGLYSNTIPALGTGPAGFGRYYWRQFTDQVSGTFFTEAIFPTLTHEDPRYYTLGKKGFFKRSSYAISRTFITKNDRGTNEFNISEIGGNASEAALSNLYYPTAERGFGKSAKNFATQTVITAGANVLKEFWPDIRKNVFRTKDESPPRP